ncbi:MAG: ferritin-like domain-containing protein [Gaiellaceae bacterium]
MASQKQLDALNKLVSNEYAAFLQYLQQSFLVHGTEREVFREFFEDVSKEAVAHAKLWGEKIVALGGIPTVEPGAVRQSRDLLEMLEHDLALEAANLEDCKAALRIAEAEDDVALRVMLEDHIVEETGDVEELEKLLSKKRIGVAGEQARQAKR